MPGHARKGAEWTCLMLTVVLGGCAQPPRGSTGGRIDMGKTTDAERASPRILPGALIEFSDQVAQELAQDLAEVRTIRDAPSRCTIIVGDINNKTQIVSSDEFEMTRSRIRNNLLQSQYVTDRLKFVENRARIDQLRQREMVLPQEGPVGPDAYDPQTTYALNGDFYRVHRGNVNQYYMEFQLVHFASNEIVFSERYEVKQRS